MDMSLDDIIAQKNAAVGRAPRQAASQRLARRPGPYLREDGSTRGHAAVPGSSVYVGNLSWDVSWQHLKDHFKVAGHVVHADVMTEASTGRSKGCGIVTFGSAHEAANAIALLHDSQLNGRSILVREDREAGNDHSGGAGVSTSVYVGNLAWDVSWQDLKDHFKAAGHVVHADVMTEASTGRSKGCGIVTFGSAHEAAHAIALLHDSELNGRSILVREDREAGGGGGAAGAEALRGGAAVPTSVYVGNLAWDVSWQHLKDHFKVAGHVVHADVMTEASTGRSKGCGIVTFGSAHEAAHAIALLHDSQLNGRSILVREDREAGGGGGAAGAEALRGGAAVPTSVYVGNLSYDVSWQHLKDHFKAAGHVVHADVMTEASTGRSKGCGIVTFGSAREAAHAINTLNETVINGRAIFVREDRDSSKAPAVAIPAYYQQRASHLPATVGGRAGSASAGCKVHVGNLAWETTWQDLKHLLKAAGHVVRADVAQGSDGRSKGFGTATFTSPSEAAKAIQMFHETEYKGRLLSVTPDAS
ncbi:hypothetical protein AB1Y20_018680 [Prymnesium parvum]|uniref:RRM domain-containing protein n=1 Tax=Prymnesium parvum TaxID=97485 RepID=A0AB34JS65_PRYPA